MSFQAYLDNIQAKAGKSPDAFKAMAVEKGYCDDTGLRKGARPARSWTAEARLRMVLICQFLMESRGTAFPPLWPCGPDPDDPEKRSFVHLDLAVWRSGLKRDFSAMFDRST